jgi:hypothetical protein
MTNAVRSALNRGIRFLQTHQFPDGEFGTLASSSGDLGDSAAYDSNIFVTALVVQALEWISDPRVDAMMAASVSFLRSEMRPHGLWQFWTRKSGREIAADLDDTACAAGILRRHRIEFPAHHHVILENRDSHGRFYTWIRDEVRNPQIRDIPAEHRDNVDAAVNANVLQYLGPGNHVSAVVNFLRESLRTGNPDLHAYYLDTLCVAYFAGRAFRSGIPEISALRPEVSALVSRKLEGSARQPDPLHLALAISTACLFSIDDSIESRSEQDLLASQGPEGNWPAVAMFLGPAPYYGSTELTTALAVEALARVAASAQIQSQTELGQLKT